MTRALIGLSILACATGCPTDSANTSDSSPTEATTGTTTDGTTGTTTDVAPTSTTTETAPTTGTTDTTTGDEAAVGERIIYMRDVGDGDADLYMVDCSGPVPGPPLQINHPTPEGAAGALGIEFSPSRRWLTYEVVDGRVGSERWIVDVSGAVPGPPVRIDLPPDPSFTVGVLEFSEDESQLALIRYRKDTGSQLYLCTLGSDGSCAPEAWGLPLAPAGAFSSGGFTFSKDGAHVFYASDPEGDGDRHYYMAGTAPGDAGKAIQLTGGLAPAETLIDRTWLSPDGEVLYYRYHTGGPETGVRAIDVSVSPPAAPVELVDGNLRADTTAGYHWEGVEGLGDLYFYSLDRTEAGPLVLLHDVPGRVRDGARWSPDGRFIVYQADTEEAPKAWQIFAVDVSGPTPKPPVKLAEVAAGGAITEVDFGVDPSLLVFNARPTSDAGDDLWMARLEPPGPAVMVNAPLPAMGTISNARAFSPAGGRVAFTGEQESADVAELFMVELAAPGMPIKLAAPTDELDIEWWGHAFSHDGQRVYYSVREPNLKKSLFQVETAAPGAGIKVAAPDHDAALLEVLPASGG